MSLCHALVDLALITDGAAKLSKMQLFLVIIDSPGGLLPVTYIFRQCNIYLTDSMPLFYNV